GITRDKFFYNLSRADYEKDWGKQYRRPGISARILAFVIGIVPKIGPLRSFSFRTPTPEMEKLFMASFNATRDRYKSLLEAERTRKTHPADVNLDVGKPTAAGMYRTADQTYAKLVDELAKDNFAAMPRELRDDILNFYKNESTPAFPGRD